jgi:hypothetical protein
MSASTTSTTQPETDFASEIDMVSTGKPESDADRETRILKGRSQPTGTNPKRPSRASKSAAKTAADPKPKSSKPAPKPVKSAPKSDTPAITDREKNQIALTVAIALHSDVMNATAFAKLQRRFPALKNLTLTEFRAFVSHRDSYVPAACEWPANLAPRTQFQSR